MSQRPNIQSRNDLLADVAEMYYLERQTQSEIAKHIGLTRSMISRMLDEARNKGIVEFRVNRSLSFDEHLERALIEGFGLKSAHVVIMGDADSERILRKVGVGAAQVLRKKLRPGMILGLAWGTFIRSTLEAFELEEPVPGIRVVQLAGAGDSRIKDYDGHALVQRMTQLTGGEGIFLNAPIMVNNEASAQSLMASKTIREVIQLSRQSDLALLGIGSTDPRYSTFYHSGYFSLNDLTKLQEDAAVGNVCGMHFTIDGTLTSLDFQHRLVTISKEDLINIDIRMGVAGGLGKVDAILGALRGGFINVLVTDNVATTALLKRANH
ncbi:MAG: sugar-binding transcriptional regulator [Anaerolineales bacterium]